MFAVILLPQCALQAVLRDEPALLQQPVALLDASARPLVTQLTQPALRAGVQPGMTAPQALARCPNLLLKSPHPAREAAVQHTLLQIAATLSPAIEDTQLGLCTLDLHGTSTLWGSGETLAHHAISALAASHLLARVGLADTPQLALYAASGSPSWRRIEPGQHLPFLQELPLSLLEPPAELHAIFASWGLASLADLIALPRAEIADRLGPEGTALWDRAAARDTRPLRLVRPPESFAESLELDHEIEQLEPLLFLIRRFLDHITQRLQTLHRVAESLDITLRFARGTAHHRNLPIPAPTASPEVLFRLLHTHLESLRAEAPIVALHLEARPALPRRDQRELFDHGLRDINQFHETLARLTAALGGSPLRVGTPVPQATHRADQFELAPCTFGLPATAAKASQPLVPPPPLTLPLRRFRPPREVRVWTDSSDRRPIALNCTGSTQPIDDCRGPWRSSGQWWDDRAWSSDEWDIQMATGEIYRLSRTGPQWFLEGIYD